MRPPRASPDIPCAYLEALAQPEHPLTAMTTTIDFDFAQYVNHRRGLVHQRARDGSAYSFSGERKFRRVLNTAKPVSLAIEAASRMWKTADLIANTDRASDENYPNVLEAGKQAGKMLNIDPPPIYVLSGDSPIIAQTLGTNFNASVFINHRVVDQLTTDELVCALGNEFGHIQNNHVVYLTALYFLEHGAKAFVRWIIKPATVTLQAWSRRAEISCDRAALLCGRDIETTLLALTKVAFIREGKPLDDSLDYIQEATHKPGPKAYTDVFRSSPHLSKRLEAVHVFAQSALYKQFTEGQDTEGLSTDDVDGQVSELLSFF